MAGKVVSYFISGILLFSISVPLCFADEFEELYRTKENICSLIEKGKFSEAKTAADNMAIEYVGQEKLPEMLYWVAARFQVFDRFEDAKGIYQQIIQNFPESPWAKKAKMGSAMTEAISLVVSGKFTEAKAVTDKMAVDFAGNPDLAETLYWIAERFQRADRFDEAKQNYQRIIDDFPAASFAQKAKLAISRAQVESLIVSQKYDDANAALAQFIADFAKSPDLPEALFWLTERYERLVRLEEARRAYQQIIDRFPNNLYAKRAKLGISRAEVIAFVEAADFNNAVLALNKMTSDFAGHSDLPWSLYLVAQRYESKGRQEDANSVYQQIVGSYPNSLYASKIATEGTEVTEIKDANLNPDLEKAAIEVYRVARGFEEANDFNSAAKAYQQVVRDYPATIKGGNAVLDIRRLEIWEKIGVGEVNEAGILLDKFVADFKKNLYASNCLDSIAEKCYGLAAKLNEQNQLSQAYSNFALAEGIWQRIIDNSTGPLDVAYSSAAACRRNQNKFIEAIEYYQKVVDDYPDSESAYGAQLAVAFCYEKMQDANQVPKEEINPLLEEAYKKILAKYPERDLETLFKLGWLTFNQGRLQESVSYFEKVLDKYQAGSKPPDVLYAVGCYYQKTGQTEKAVKTYQELLNTLPDGDPQAQNVQQKLSQLTRQ